MTKAELVEQVLKGVIVVVGEYRGSHAELAGYVDKKTGNAIKYVRAFHLVERISWDRDVERVLLTRYFPDSVKTVEDAAATFTYERGRKYVFYIESFKWDRGQLNARLAAWEPEPLEESEQADGSPSGEPPPF